MGGSDLAFFFFLVSSVGFSWISLESKIIGGCKSWILQEHGM